MRCYKQRQNAQAVHIFRSLENIYTDNVLNLKVANLAESDFLEAVIDAPWDFLQLEYKKSL